MTENIGENRRSPLISVIIPVYNMEKYISDCIGSIVSQTYRNIEIIIIDDGSSDSGGKICDRFAIEDSRIRVVHKENQGRSKARNDGLDIMEGAFFLFVDADDILPSDAIETMVNAMSDEGGLVSGLIRPFSGDTSQEIKGEGDSGNVSQDGSKCNLTDVRARDVSREEFLESFALNNMHGTAGNCEMDNGAVARLYPKELNAVRFPEDLSFAEDYLYSLTILIDQKKIRYIDKPVYYYRKYDEGEKHFWKSFKRLSLEDTEARIRAVKLVKKKGDSIYQDFLLRSYYSILDNYCTCIKLGYYDSADKIAAELDSIKEGVKKGESIRKLGLFQRLKLSLSFMSYRLYALLYLFRRRKEVQWKMSR